jgi:hypothetical protein
MALSGTFGFNPSMGDAVLYAYGLCGIRRAQVLQVHMVDARIAANLVLADWLNQGTNLWQVELVTQTLTKGVSTYVVDPSILVLLDAYVTIGPPGPPIDRVILPISRTEYANYPNKTQQGFPTVFWMNRILTPTVTLWPVPDGQTPTLSYYALQQAQDANFSNGQNVDIPYAWLNAFALGLAEKLAMSWAPDRLPMLSPAAAKAYDIAARAGVETASTYISPMLSSYYRT